MRHKRKTFKVGRPTGHRAAMMGNLLASLFTYGTLETTVVKAKELRRRAEKMITHAKAGDLHNRRLAIASVRSVDAVRVLFDTVAPAYATRQGGYTRQVRNGYRKGDGAETAIVELIDNPIAAAAKASTETSAPQA